MAERFRGKKFKIFTGFNFALSNHVTHRTCTSFTAFEFITITIPNNKLNPITLGHLTLRVGNGCTHKVSEP